MYNQKIKRKRINGNSFNRGRSHLKRKNGFSQLDPVKMVNTAMNNSQTETVETSSIMNAPIHKNLQENLLKMGFKYLTPIQEKTITPLNEGRDLVGIAKTGTGKTAAFIMPLVNQWINNEKPFRAMVIVPTRELAIQIHTEFDAISRGMGFKAISVIGGTSVMKDLKLLRQNYDLLIGTPGRLIDLMRRRALEMNAFKVLVLDEFDRMLDMGFIDDVNTVTQSMVNREQTILFSATLDHSQKNLINRLLNNPVSVTVSSGAPTSEQIQQDIIRIPKGTDKFKMLVNLIDDPAFEKVLLFAETRRLVDRVSKKLNKYGVRTDQIHGDKSQQYRIKAFNKFKKGQVQVLVATDVAARGLDVSNITHVINYQVPRTMDSYIHRIGRTGRAGQSGRAITLVD